VLPRELQLTLRQGLGEVDDGVVQGAIAESAPAAGAVVVDGFGGVGYGAEVWGGLRV
jgi:hypothetical protein